MLLLLLGCGNQAVAPNQENTTTMLTIPAQFDWQGHRGARGLLPENSIPGFLKALEFPIRTLELDVVVSRDKQVVVSHEPWMSAEICTHPDGRSAVQPNEAKSLNLYRMDYGQIRLYDCGSRGNARFPEQLPQPVYKPTLKAVVEEAESACARMNRSLPNYNIELKAMPEWDQLMTPEPAEFCRLVLEVLKEARVLDRTSIQSFDVRILREMRRQAPTLKLVYLVEQSAGLAEDLRRLGFSPAIYSPHFLLLNEEVVAQAHEQGMQVVPWTVNEPDQMELLIRMGVDGIITDYPNRISPLLDKLGRR
jgi:glycerophosphoryl diester phosphodiesterase